MKELLFFCLILTIVYGCGLYAIKKNYSWMATQPVAYAPKTVHAAGFSQDWR